MSLINCIFSPFGIEAKRIENSLPLGLEDNGLHFNKRPESCKPSFKLFVTMTHSLLIAFSFVMHCFN